MKRKYTSTSEDGGLHIVLSQLRPYLSFPTLPPSHQQISASPIYKSLYSARGMIKSEQEMHNQNLVFPLAFSQYTASEDTSSAVDEEEGAAVETSVESIDDGAIEEVNSAVHSNPPLESHQDQDDSDREGGSMSSKSSVEKDEWILKLVPR